MKTFYKSISRQFSKITFQSNAKTENSNVLCKIGHEDYIKISNPINALLGLFSTCETKTIMFFAQKNNINIKDIKVNVDGTFDFANFNGKDLTIPNTYQEINAEITIESNEKDKVKLESLVQTSIDKCPVGATLKLAGIPIKHKVNYVQI